MRCQQACDLVNVVDIVEIRIFVVVLVTIALELVGQVFTIHIEEVSCWKVLLHLCQKLPYSVDHGSHFKAVVVIFALSCRCRSCSSLLLLIVLLVARNLFNITNHLEWPTCPSS